MSDSIDNFKLPLDIENKNLKLEIQRLHREIEHLRVDVANLSSSAAALGVNTVIEEEKPKLSKEESVKMSLDTLATILSIHTKNDASAAVSTNSITTTTTTKNNNSSSSSSDGLLKSSIIPPSSSDQTMKKQIQLDIENISLNLDINRLKREVEYLRNEKAKSEAIILPISTKSKPTEYNQKSSFAVLLDSGTTTTNFYGKPIPLHKIKPSGLTNNNNDNNNNNKDSKKNTKNLSLGDLSTEESSHLLLALSKRQNPNKSSNKLPPPKVPIIPSSKVNINSISQSGISQNSQLALPLPTDQISKITKPKISKPIITVYSHASMRFGSPIPGPWNLCSFIVKRLHTDVTNFKYNLKRRHHDHSITQLQGRYYLCKVCFSNPSKSTEALHHASLDYVKFITLHFKKEHKDLLQSIDNDDYLPHIISIPIPNEMLAIINGSTCTYLDDPNYEDNINIYIKLVSVLNNDEGVDKKTVKRRIEEILKGVENNLLQYQNANLDIYIKNYMQNMPLEKTDVKKLLESHAFNYYAYFSSIEQAADSKAILMLEDDFYDDIDNINEYINSNNRDNTTKIKKYTRVRNRTGSNVNNAPATGIITTVNLPSKQLSYSEENINILRQELEKSVGGKFYVDNNMTTSDNLSSDSEDDDPITFKRKVDIQESNKMSSKNDKRMKISIDEILKRQHENHNLITKVHEADDSLIIIK